ncbi:PIN domain-containing protein [Candidatus Pacearchaeota archaeon]|nr:PIN domain-containing protein [Candidatus Pacearchaeota archaeon]
MGLRYFFDSYAIIEIVKNNPKYLPYSEEDIVLTLFNLAEIYWSSSLDYGEEKADEVYSKFRENVVEIDDETLKEAIKFRKEHKKQDFSYTDCIGFIYSKRNNLKFLTGDSKFEHLPFVEFVKK